jgi:hypothetical protein
MAALCSVECKLMFIIAQWSNFISLFCSLFSYHLLEEIGLKIINKEKNIKINEKNKEYEQ